MAMATTARVETGNAPVKPGNRNQKFHHYHISNLNEYVEIEGATELFSTYQVIKTFGKGNHAVVKVEHKHNPFVKLAIKAIDYSSDSNDIYKTSTMGEFVFPTLMDHPNIVKLYDVVQTSQQMFFFMEAGPDKTFHDLHKNLYNRPIRLREIALKAPYFELLNGLCYMHSNQTFHRDLKPKNVLSNTTGSIVKIVDFGYNTIFSKNGAKSHGGCFTTFTYAPPECFGAFNCKYNGAEIDVWSYGAMLFEGLTGKAPYRFPKNFSYDTAEHISTAKRVFPFLFDEHIMTFEELLDTAGVIWTPEEVSKVSPELKDLLSRLLTPNRKTRIQYGITSMFDVARHPWFNKNEQFSYGIILQSIKNDTSPLRYLAKPAVFPAKLAEQYNWYREVVNGDIFQRQIVIRRLELLNKIFGLIEEHPKQAFLESDCKITLDHEYDYDDDDDDDDDDDTSSCSSTSSSNSFKEDDISALALIIGQRLNENAEENESNKVHNGMEIDDEVESRLVFNQEQNNAASSQSEDDFESESDSDESDESESVHEEIDVDVVPRIVSKQQALSSSTQSVNNSSAQPQEHQQEHHQEYDDDSEEKDEELGKLENSTRLISHKANEFEALDETLPQQQESSPNNAISRELVVHKQTDLDSRIISKLPSQSREQIPASTSSDKGQLSNDEDGKCNPNPLDRQPSSDSTYMESNSSNNGEPNNLNNVNDIIVDGSNDQCVTEETALKFDDEGRKSGRRRRVAKWFKQKWGSLRQSLKVLKKNI